MYLRNYTIDMKKVPNILPINIKLVFKIIVIITRHIKKIRIFSEVLRIEFVGKIVDNA